MTSANFLLLLALQQPSQLTGAVRDSTSALPIAGAVVQLLDATGRPYDRAVTDLAGRYRVVPTAAVTRVQFLKLGYRPRSFDLASLRDSNPTLDVAMARLPTLLTPVTATSNRLCPRRRDSNAAIALWQEARTGLLQSMVASQTTRAFLDAAVFERFIYDGDPRPQSVRIASGERGIAFGAAFGARDFLRLGFIQAPDSTGVRGIYGPDAAVLLHEDFSAGYCFSVADRDRQRPNQMGLRFQPVSRAPNRVDIDGVLWVDTLARTIKDIQFHYLGYERIAESRRPGGFTSFVTLPNGQLLIDEWLLRVISAVPDTIRVRGKRRIVGAYRLYETGGELTRGRWPAPDSAVYEASLGSLRLRVKNGRGQPLQGATIRIDSTDYVATTDSLGHADFRDMIPGLYEYTALDTSLARIGPAFDTLTFTIKRGVRLDTTLTIRTAEDYAAKHCGAYLDAPSGRGIVARVFDDAGEPVAGIEWSFYGQDGKADENGVLAVCVRGMQDEKGNIVPPTSLELLLWPNGRGRGKEPQTAQVPLSGRITVARLDLVSQ